MEEGHGRLGRGSNGVLTASMPARHQARGLVREARRPSGGHGVGKDSEDPAVPRFNRRGTVPPEIALRQVVRGKVARAPMLAADRPFNGPSTTVPKGVPRSVTARPMHPLRMSAVLLKAGSVPGAPGGLVRPRIRAVRRAGRGAAIGRLSGGPSRAGVVTAHRSAGHSTVAMGVIVRRIDAHGMAATAAVANLRCVIVPSAPGGNGARALLARARVRARTIHPLRRRHVPTIRAMSRAQGSVATVLRRVHARGSVGMGRPRIGVSAGDGMAASVARGAPPMECGRPSLLAHDRNERPCNGRPASWRGRGPRGRRTGSCAPR